jgi:hypothetical protein
VPPALTPATVEKIVINAVMAGCKPEYLSQLQRSQEPAVQQGVKLRQRVEALAGGTAQFAADGNENAKAIVEEMKRQGVTLSQPKK